MANYPATVLADNPIRYYKLSETIRDDCDRQRVAGAQRDVCGRLYAW